MDPGCCTPDLALEAGALPDSSASSQSRSGGKIRLSERRYTAESADPESPDKSFEPQEKEFSLTKLTTSTSQHSKPPSILRLRALKPCENHQRKRSHHRQKSIYFSAEKTYDQVIEELEKENIAPNQRTDLVSPQPCSKLKAHIRTISDTDSVVYTGPAEDQILQDSLETAPPFQRQSTNSTVKGLGERETMTALEEIYEKAGEVKERPLPILGLLPCSAYCQKCGLDVHTTIDFDLKERSRMSSALISLFGPVLSCCEVPLWLNKLKVHRCSVCRSAVARSA